MNRHFPCGHWHKGPTKSRVSIPDIYLEMYNISIWTPERTPTDPNPTIPEEMYLTIDPNDYDGSNVEFWWEVLGNNTMHQQYAMVEPYTMYLVDTDGNEYASFTFEPETPVAGEMTMQRKRVKIELPNHEVTLAVKFPPSLYENYTYLSCPQFAAIRIIVKQSNDASKSMVKIPLQCLGDWGDCYNYYVGSGHYDYSGFYYYSHAGYNSYSKTHYGDSYYDDELFMNWDWYATTGLWRYSSDEFSTVSKVMFEAAAGTQDSRDDMYIALFDATTGEMVEGSELHWPPYTFICRKQVLLDPSKLTNGHEYEMRFRVTNNGGIGGCLGFECNLYLWLNPIKKVSGYYIIGKGEYQDYSGDNGINFTNDEGRLLLNLPNGFKAYFENVAFAWYWPGPPAVNPDDYTNEELYDYHETMMFYALTDSGTATYGQSGTDVSGSRLWWYESDCYPIEVRKRKRSEALTLINGHEYIVHEPNGEAYLFQIQATLILKPN